MTLAELDQARSRDTADLAHSLYHSGPLTWAQCAERLNTTYPGNTSTTERAEQALATLEDRGIAVRCGFRAGHTLWGYDGPHYADTMSGGCILLGSY